MEAYVYHITDHTLLFYSTKNISYKIICINEIQSILFLLSHGIKYQIWVHQIQYTVTTPPLKV